MALRYFSSRAGCERVGRRSRVTGRVGGRRRKSILDRTRYLEVQTDPCEPWWWFGIGQGEDVEPWMMEVEKRQRQPQQTPVGTRRGRPITLEKHREAIPDYCVPWQLGSAQTMQAQGYEVACRRHGPFVDRQGRYGSCPERIRFATAVETKLGHLIRFLQSRGSAYELRPRQSSPRTSGASTAFSISTTNSKTWWHITYTYQVKAN